MTLQPNIQCHICQITNDHELYKAKIKTKTKLSQNGLERPQELFATTTSFYGT